jgi:hypothetical protein
MRPNKLYRATLILISLLSLAATAAAQAGQTRSDPIDSKGEKITVTVRAAADTPADQLHRATLTLISLLSLAETDAAQAGQTRSDPVENSEEKIEVTVREADAPDEHSYKATLRLDSLQSLAETAAVQAGQARTDPVDNSEEKIGVTVWAAADTAAEEQLSQDFAAAASRATALLREWQRHIASTIRFGLPLCESCIAEDRDQAAEALRLATLLASKDADRTALQELLDLFENFQQWSDALIEDNRNGELGRYYMSPVGLNDDPILQKTAQCAQFLAPMLASGRLAEDPSCQ